MIEVCVADAMKENLWEQYVHEKKLAHHAYSWNWRSILSEVFHHRPHYLIAEHVAGEERSARGILPLFQVQSVLFGNALISLPYLNAGGICADDSESFQALRQRAEELAREIRANYLELRHRGPCELYSTTVPSRTHKVSMLLNLKSDPEELFQSFPAKLRSQIRRPSKSGVWAEVHRGDRDAVERFYAVFSENMRDLGTPVYPRALFLKTLERFQEALRVILVFHETKPIAAGITLNHNGYVEIPWASSLKKYNSLSGNMLLYWEAIKAACLDGATVFDFGRSSHDSGTYRFKLQWGAKELPLHWYYPLSSSALPDVNPNNPKYRLLVSCWQKLPLQVANCLGPWLTRALP